jgi:hypothetical protein
MRMAVMDTEGFVVPLPPEGVQLSGKEAERLNEIVIKARQVDGLASSVTPPSRGTASVTPSAGHAKAGKHLGGRAQAAIPLPRDPGAGGRF